jgi:uncharacterized membrane protein
MTTSSRESVLFWCQVGLYVTAMVTLLGILATFWFVLMTQMRAMEEDRARSRAELQQHTEAMQDHARAREQHARAFEAMLERLAR